MRQVRYPTASNLSPGLFALFSEQPLPEGSEILEFSFPLDPHRHWDAHKAEFLSGWIEQHPGERPDVWYQLDCTERRRQISGSGKLEGGWWRGIPKRMAGVAPDDAPMFEAERDFLLRLKILDADEAKRALQNIDAITPLLWTPATIRRRSFQSSQYWPDGSS